MLGAMSFHIIQAVNRKSDEEFEPRFSRNKMHTYMHILINTLPNFMILSYGF